MDRNKYVVQCRKVMNVALRKESVDRNANPGSTELTFPVALRKESVDRNEVTTLREAIPSRGRSPQGERG